MFLTFNDVMVNGLFIIVEGLSLDVEAGGILVDADVRQHASCSEIYLQTTAQHSLNKRIVHLF
jgi:hypothetical protein